MLRDMYSGSINKTSNKVPIKVNPLRNTNGVVSVAY